MATAPITRMTVQAARRYLGVCRHTIYRMIKRGELVAERKRGRWVVLIPTGGPDGMGES